MSPAVRRLLAVGVAAAHVGVLVAPTLILAAAADKGGVPDRDGTVLLTASLGVGIVSGSAAARHLVVQRVDDVRDVVIASLDALVVLALGATGLLFLALGAYEPAAPILVNRGWPVVATWVLAQGAAAALAEATRAAVLRWLGRDARTDHPPHRP